MNKLKLTLILSLLCFVGQGAKGLGVIVTNSYTEPIKVFLAKTGSYDGDHTLIGPGQSCVYCEVDATADQIWVAPKSRGRWIKKGHYAKNINMPRVASRFTINGFKYEGQAGGPYKQEGALSPGRLWNILAEYEMTSATEDEIDLVRIEQLKREKPEFWDDVLVPDLEKAIERRRLQRERQSQK